MTLRLDGESRADLDVAAGLLRGGGLVAFPTETVYGLGADGLNPDAVARIFAAKGRPSDNPLILHVVSLEAALVLWRGTDGQIERARRLAMAFWPGPLTLVLPVKPLTVPMGVTAGLDSVAVRMPDHPVARALIERTGHPLAAPSANLSGRPSPTTAAHVLRTLEGRIDAVVDGGPTRVGLESTVVDLRGARVRILREGSIARARLAAALDAPVDGPAGSADESAADARAAPGAGASPAAPGRDSENRDAEAPGAERDADEPARAPGMRHRHYAPLGVSVRVVPAAVVRAAWAGHTAILCRESLAQACIEELGNREAELEVLPDAVEGYSRGLYAALHRLEQGLVSELLIERLPDDEAWRAARDRIERAAAG